MSLEHVLKKALGAAKKHVHANLSMVREKTGDINPYGDETLLLDLQAENEILKIVQQSSVGFSILTEEQGLISCERNPEYLLVVDPVDGSANLERGIPLVSAGISAIPYSNDLTTDEIEASVIDSFFTDETYVAISGQGVRRNGKSVRVSDSRPHEQSIISYDTKREWTDDFGQSSLRTLRAVHDMRRTASNLLDLCWTASGALDAMIDLRGELPIVHICGTHMVKEAGGFVLHESGKTFRLPVEPDVSMSFVAASNEEFARYLLSAFRSKS
ncbi:hypothetical protein EU545_00355 [Candidatus Thorarchaeota archaeon]|nr:MAG: hypothetical protein EU545_00355 [Candidatus Thorarchaeota archaeon]